MEVGNFRNGSGVRFLSLHLVARHACYLCRATSRTISPSRTTYVRSMYPSANTDPAVLLFYVFQPLHLDFFVYIFCTQVRLTAPRQPVRRALRSSSCAAQFLFWQLFLRSPPSRASQRSQRTLKVRSLPSLPFLHSRRRTNNLAGALQASRLATENLPRTLGSGGVAREGCFL